MEVLHCDAQPSAGRSFALHLNKWKKIGAPYTILRWIENGVPLPLHNVPRLRILRNFRLDNLQTSFVEEELSHLLRLGAILPPRLPGDTSHFTHRSGAEEERRQPTHH